MVLAFRPGIVHPDRYRLKELSRTILCDVLLAVLLLAGTVASVIDRLRPGQRNPTISSNA
jgi:hypothetical protein